MHAYFELIFLLFRASTVGRAGLPELLLTCAARNSRKEKQGSLELGAILDELRRDCGRGERKERWGEGKGVAVKLPLKHKIAVLVQG